MIRCLIIDDEPLAIEVIKTHLSKLEELELVAAFNNPVEALETINTNTIDLIFLDIEMPLLTGIEFLKTLDNLPKVIFTTAYRNFAIESYELEVVDYLLKPISFSRLFKAVNKFKKQTKVPVMEIATSEESITNDHMYVNANKKFIKIKFDDILYIESVKDYVRIHLPTKSVVTKDSISNFEDKLPNKFLRIHRSFIVNSKKVTAFTKVDIEIGKIEIPISASYKEGVIGFLSGF
ncbi:LytR/AlgR family response regulator transcription factor [Patiriisocius sp. Uisw_017]|jgi:DNA-binding LytR/AlgR family response regulator|uniref:LytR/AlgR family response regulator transcription factor n=1 Tax=Patiriisocius sp. Uisw_017 TaxID=3230968 RepID=UPI0039ECE585